MQFSVLKQGDTRYLTVVAEDGRVETTTSDHPKWDAIWAGVQAGDENVVDLFDIGQAVSEMFRKVTDRVVLRGGRVLLDNDPVDEELSDTIVRYLESDEEDAMPLVKFLENTAANPNEHSREQAYRWLAHHSFAFTDDGHILAYKGVATNGNGGFTSISSGKAIVNGTEVSGRIPQKVGDVVEMPRSEVQHDPRVGCHTGLHAGTWNYASGFAKGAVITVKINPRDIVSVPTDCSSEKVRVCRYEVVDAVDKPYSAIVVRTEVQDGQWGDGEGAVEVEDVTKAEPVEVEDKSAKPKVGDRVRVGDGSLRKIGGGRYLPRAFRAAHGKTGVIGGEGRTGTSENYFWVDLDEESDGVKCVDVWPDEVTVLKPLAGSKTKSSRPTANNHLRQKRGPDGKFLPKAS